MQLLYISILVAYISTSVVNHFPSKLYSPLWVVPHCARHPSGCAPWPSCCVLGRSCCTWPSFDKPKEQWSRVLDACKESVADGSGWINIQEVLHTFCPSKFDSCFKHHVRCVLPVVGVDWLLVENCVRVSFGVRNSKNLCVSKGQEKEVQIYRFGFQG